MLERTDTEWGPWTIVPATDDRFAQVTMFESIIQRLERQLGRIASSEALEPVLVADEGDGA